MNSNSNMYSKRGGSSRSGEINKTNVTSKKDPIETWLSGLGFNPEPSEMEALLTTIRSNQKLEFYFNTLKNNCKPLSEADKIHKYYLYSILKGGCFGFDVPKHFKIKGQSDIEFNEKYLKSYNKIKAFRIVKLPEASQLLKDLNKKLDKEKQAKDRLLDHFLVQTDRLNSLSGLEVKLASLKSEIVAFKKVTRVVNGKLKSSERFKQSQACYFLKMEQILNIPSEILMKKTDKEIVVLVLNYFKILSNELNAFLKESEEFSLEKLFDAKHDLHNAQGTLSVRTEDEIKHFLKINRQIVTTVQDIMLKAKNFKMFLTDFSTNYDLQKKSIFINMQRFEDKIFNLKSEINEYINVFKGLSEVENAKLIKLENDNYEKYLQIESILNKLGTSINSTFAGSVLTEKQQIITLYKQINGFPDNFCFSLTSINFNQERLKPFVDMTWSCQQLLNEIEEIISTKNNLPSYTRLITYMPFVKVNGIPLIDVMEEVKQLIIEKKMYDLMTL